MFGITRIVFMVVLIMPLAITLMNVMMRAITNIKVMIIIQT